jgi:hypothetical protein
VNRSDLLKLVKTQVGIDQKQIAQSGRELGVGRNALGQCIGRGAHLLGKAHLGQGGVGLALLLYQAIG